MKVDIFRNTVKRRGTGASFEMMKAWQQGIKSQGDEPIWVEGKPDPEMWMGDPQHRVGIVFGYGPDTSQNFLKGNRRKIRQHHQKNGGVVICFDGGLWTSFGNKASSENHHYRQGLWQPMRGGNFLNADSPSDRWENLKKIFNIQERPWRKNGDYILLCTQPQDNWSMAGKDPFEWAVQVKNEIRKYTDRPIKIRPHPNHRDRALRICSELLPDCPVTDITLNEYRYTFLQELENAWCVVTHNSTAAVDAVTYGIPVFMTADTCLAWEMGSNDFSTIENPIMPDRTQWLNDLAYANWSIQEVKDGTVWKKFKPQIEAMIK